MADDKYADERNAPKVPQCGSSGLSLQFDGSYLRLLGGKKPYSYPAKSGKPGKYDPIPKGKYWVQPSQLWSCTLSRQIVFALGGESCNSSGWGNYRLTIHSYPGSTSARGGFFIHGGDHDGSAGCINVGLRIDDFVRDMQSELQGKDCYIPLMVQ